MFYENRKIYRRNMEGPMFSAESKSEEHSTTHLQDDAGADLLKENVEISVRDCQTALKNLSNLTGNADFDPGLIDGISGPNTNAAILAFKRAYNLRYEPGIEINNSFDFQTVKALEQFKKEFSPEVENQIKGDESLPYSFNSVQILAGKNGLKLEDGENGDYKKICKGEECFATIEVEELGYMVIGQSGYDGNYINTKLVASELPNAMNYWSKQFDSIKQKRDAALIDNFLERGDDSFGSTKFEVRDGLTFSRPGSNDEGYTRQTKEVLSGLPSDLKQQLSILTERGLYLSKENDKVIIHRFGGNNLGEVSLNPEAGGNYSVKIFGNEKRQMTAKEIVGAILEA